MKREELLVLGLVCLILVLLSIVSFFTNNVDEGSARQFVLEDLKSRFPYADVEIIESKSAVNNEGKEYFSIKAKVTTEAQSACPLRSHYYYSYPEQNFVPAPADHITTPECKVCKETPCIIAFPEEATIASHTLSGTEQVKEFVNSHPYSNHSVTNNGSVFIVSWFDTEQGYNVTISRSGKVLSVLPR